MQVYSMLFFQLNINCYRVKSALIATDGASPQSITQAFIAIQVLQQLQNNANVDQPQYGY